MNVPVVSRLMPEVSMDSLVGKQLPDSNGTLTSMRSFGDSSKERKYVPATREPVGLFRSDGSAQMGPLRYPGPEANRWHEMLLSLTLMQTLTSIALQSLPELQPNMQQQPSQPNMPILRPLTFSYHLLLRLRARGMLRPLS